MIGAKTRQYASLLVNYSVAVKPGDTVHITSNTAGREVVIAVYRAVVQAGGHPLVSFNDEIFSEILLKEGTDDQLAYISPVARHIMEQFDCRINIGAPRNKRALTGIDPQRHQLRRRSQRELNEIFFRRSASGELRWVSSAYPTDAAAQDASKSLDDYTDFVFRACLLDSADPVAAWQQLSERQQQLVDWLTSKKEVIVKGPNIDLILSIDGRRFINDDGHYNMPGGEIFTGPVESQVDGWVRFTYPALYSGRELNGVELRFEGGKVVEASANNDEAFLHSMLDTDPGARYLGEFAIGTNEGVQAFSRSTLFDEKLSGTVHMAIGSGYQETGSENKSSIHWDMITDMHDGGQIWVDGELFYEGGRFTVLDNA